MNQNQIVKYEVSGQEIELSPDIIRNYLVSGDGRVTDQEVMMFLSLCKYQKLNPFLREAYLVKYGSQPATIVTGKETYTKRAAASPLCDGYKAGIYVVTKDGEMQKREGAMFVKALGETVVGGWAEVYRKDWKVPVYNEVAFDEYVGRKRDGSITKMWSEKGGTMIRKVALVQALREGLPEELGGTYSPEEISSINLDDLSEDAVEIVQVPVESTEPEEEMGASQLTGSTSPHTTKYSPSVLLGIEDEKDAPTGVTAPQNGTSERERTPDTKKTAKIDKAGQEMLKKRYARNASAVAHVLKERGLSKVSDLPATDLQQFVADVDDLLGPPVRAAGKE